MNPAAVLWDMDGTIVDTEPAWLRAEREMLASWGVELTVEDERRWVGIGLWDLAAIFQQRGVRLEADAIVSSLVRRVDEQVFSGELDWRPGARELIASLTNAGIPNVLVTMATRAQAERVVAALPQGSFSGIVAGDDVTKPKPHPEPYERGAMVANASPRACVAIEDSITGARSAHAAGTVVVGVPNLLELTTAPCDIILDTLDGVEAGDLIRIYEHVREQS